MATCSVSFDDDGNEDLCVFSGNDLLISHYDVADLDWEEVAERSAIDERRGLVIAQVAILEDLVDEFILYLADPSDTDEHQATLDRLTIGPRVARLRELLTRAHMLDTYALDLLEEISRVAARRNELAHGVVHCRPVEPAAPGSWPDRIPLEWVITSRRSPTVERITMSGLRQDVYDAIGCFTSMLQYAERFVESAPRPRNYDGGWYLAPPTP